MRINVLSQNSIPGHRTALISETATDPNQSRPRGATNLHQPPQPSTSHSTPKESCTFGDSWQNKVWERRAVEDSLTPPPPSLSCWD